MNFMNFPLATLQTGHKCLTRVTRQGPEEGYTGNSMLLYLLEPRQQIHCPFCATGIALLYQCIPCFRVKTKTGWDFRSNAFTLFYFFIKFFGVTSVETYMILLSSAFILKEYFSVSALLTFGDRSLSWGCCPVHLLK